MKLETDLFSSCSLIKPSKILITLDYNLSSSGNLQVGLQSKELDLFKDLRFLFLMSPGNDVVMSFINCPVLGTSAFFSCA